MNISFIKPLIVFLSLSLFFCSCSNELESVLPSGQKSAKEITIPEFDKIDIRGQITVHLSTGEKMFLLETYENIFDYIEIYVDKGTLNVKIRNLISFEQDPEITINISNPKYEKIKISEKAKLNNLDETLLAKNLLLEIKDQGEITGNFEASEISLDFEGANASNLYIQSKKLTIELEAGEDLQLEGKTDSCTIDMKEKARLNALNFTANIVEAELRDASHAKMTIIEEIKAKLYENSTFDIEGNPEISEISIY